MPSDQRSPVPPGEAAPLELRAGPLSLLYENGMIRDIRFGGREIVRRIYAAVRDEHWNTVAGTLSDFFVEKNDSSFSLRFSSRHRKGEIDFLWNGQVSGRASGEISFSLSGIALSRFKRNRIGVCVLHPVDTYKGTPCRIETPQGATLDASFPYDIAAHQPFLNLRAMSYAITPGLDATIRFLGDIFETEDQRNWTDATYKTYSTPQSLPIPQVLEKGSMVRQTVSVHLDKPAAPVPFRPPALQIAFNAGEGGKALPPIGVMDAAENASPAALALLKKIALSHARTDIFFDDNGAASQIDRARLLQETTGMAAEFALHFTAAAADQAAELASLLEKKKPRIGRFLVFNEREPSVSAPTVRAVADALRPFAQLAGGTDRYFIEINRQRPPAELLDAVCYSATPQVHASDDVAIMENLPGLLETLASARRFSGSKGIVISPLTLRPRQTPGRPHKDGGPDHRQSTLFAAAWALGSIAYCVEGEAQSLTIGESVGPAGLMPSSGESVFPLYVLLSWLSPLAGCQARCRLGTDPRSAVGLCTVNRRPFTGIAANLTGSRRQVSFSGLPDSLCCSLLDESSFGAVRLLPDPAAGLPVEKIRPQAGRYGMELPPYALVKLWESKSA